MIRQDIIELFRVPPGKNSPAGLQPRLGQTKEMKELGKDDIEERAKAILEKNLEDLAEAQERLWADDRYAVLVVLQALDAAGKDGTIKHVMSGVNPQGCQVFSFKKPSAEELDHNFLWRYMRCLPERGRIGIFNRSYYEDVLVVKVHPELLTDQKLPPGKQGKAFWEARYEDINAFERHLVRNGTIILKFFLNVSKKEQTGRVGMQADEFKALVKALHQNGIEVILDVVFNHTAEGNEQGPTISFRGLDNRTYYMLTPGGHYYNFSGCGNTLNCNHPVVRDFVLSCLRHWVAEYHVDGFRFDLASILGRGADGTPLPNPPLLEALAMDPVLGTTKLIAEAWDAGGLYQVGTFPAYGRWAAWNGAYRDCLRRFLKGDMGQVGAMAQRLLGSPDLYPTRGPTASINFVTCHDGFTLADLVSYNHKHNEANGEENRDGTDDNQSWNCGAEGPTNDPQVLALRRRQIKNALTMLFLSQGVPMLLMGDEVGRTQQGNNNAYCLDSPLTWLDWSLQERNAELFRFCQQLIAFRQRHPALRQARHAGAGVSDADALQVTWHGTRAWRPDWAPHSRVLACMLCGSGAAGPDVVYVAMNMYWEPLGFEVPEPPTGQRWHVFANTAMPPAADIWEPGQEPPLPEPQEVLLEGRGILVLAAR